MSNALEKSILSFKENSLKNVRLHNLMDDKGKRVDTFYDCIIKLITKYDKVKNSEEKLNEAQDDIIELIEGVEGKIGDNMSGKYTFSEQIENQNNASYRTLTSSGKFIVAKNANINAKFNNSLRLFISLEKSEDFKIMETFFEVVRNLYSTISANIETYNTLATKYRTNALLITTNNPIDDKYNTIVLESTFKKALDQESHRYVSTGISSTKFYSTVKNIRVGSRTKTVPVYLDSDLFTVKNICQQFGMDTEIGCGTMLIWSMTKDRVLNTRLRIAFGDAMLIPVPPDNSTASMFSAHTLVDEEEKKEEDEIKSNSNSTQGSSSSTTEENQ